MSGINQEFSVNNLLNASHMEFRAEIVHNLALTFCLSSGENDDSFCCLDVCLFVLRWSVC